ncbi:MAG: enoyl-CoA hydratase-related protein [Candidatus Thermoplasmatota archaeon]|jgi:hypothetical protein|nr:enoyl-CoA hydratase-related protein [Candidatus Thermoplasmatota archaeon]MCL5987716.1 enoyl-CoA hydratase-related protein [Candidatus Thermoplasmatota archaeon]
MSKAPKVVGYKEISFWQEDSIGVIAIFSGPDGLASMDFFEEFLKAVTLAITDEKVKFLVITGTDDIFFRGIRGVDYTNIKSYLELTSAIASFLSTMVKPVISIINGKAENLGVELALLSDIIIARKDAEIVLSDNFEPIMGFSISALKYSFFKTGKAEEKSNCDLIMDGPEFLQKASEFIRKTGNPGLTLLRRNRLNSMRDAISIEREAFMLNSAYGITKEEGKEEQ